MNDEQMEAILRRHRPVGSPASLRNRCVQTATWTSLALAVRRDTLAHDRVTRTVLAIERFRRADGGRLPESLNDLVPRILDALPDDPSTAAPPLYRRTGDGYVVYSVGPNLKDDGDDLSLPPLEWDAQDIPYRSSPPDVGIVVTR